MNSSRVRCVVRESPLNVETTPAALQSELTPMEDFFIRTHFDIPVIDAGSHLIHLVDTKGVERSVSVVELRELGMESAVVTLECAGNSRTTMQPLPTGEAWRNGAVGTAKWAGVPLRKVLSRFGLMEGAAEILVSGADEGLLADGRAARFERSIPASVAGANGPMLALEMNDAPLSPAHGAPVRLIVPRWYGMASVKWVARITALQKAFTGYFQSDRYVYVRPEVRGGEPVREMKVKSIVTSPEENEVLSLEPITVRGFAWSGSAEVDRVEVSFGAGLSWQRATLDAARSPSAWRAWSCPWTPANPGHHVIRSRAHDRSGAVQPDIANWNSLGYGNSAVGRVSVFIR